MECFLGGPHEVPQLQHETVVRNTTVPASHLTIQFPRVAGPHNQTGCSSSCKQCGGTGCGDADPGGDGSNKCCVTEIDEAGNICSEVGIAPCILGPGTPPARFTKYPQFWRRIMYTRHHACLLYTSPSPRDRTRSRMPSSA